MYSKVNSMCVRGIDGVEVLVEVDVTSGLPEFSLVGDLAPEVKEARERVKTSLRNSGFDIPPKRITINLSPAHLRKEGTAFDLSIALGILASYEFIKEETLKDMVVLGELGLDGSVCKVSGVLPMTIAAKESGYSSIMVPRENAVEAQVVEGVDVIPVSSLSEAVGILTGEVSCEIVKDAKTNKKSDYDVDFSEVNGQIAMRRAAEVAAAGMHNILFIGSPGSGKTLIARRIPTILPDLTWSEALEVAQIYSVSGLISAANPIERVRPFRAPHHTISAPAMIGGGREPRPGEISLADRGVLFLDELPEFQKNALESLRQPLEDRNVSVVRMNGNYVFPANFMLCAAMNPCKCGYYPDRNRCNCLESDVRKYLRKVSRPLLDRIDINIEAPPVKYNDLDINNSNECSSHIRNRVKNAWEIQGKRFLGSEILFNSQMKPKDINKFCKLSESDEMLMKEAFEKMSLSARGYHKILKVARTIADLDSKENIERPHLLEALSYRGIESKIWS